MSFCVVIKSTGVILITLMALSMFTQWHKLLGHFSVSEPLLMLFTCASHLLTSQNVFCEISLIINMRQWTASVRSNAVRYSSVKNVQLYLHCSLLNCILWVKLNICHYYNITVYSTHNNRSVSLLCDRVLRPQWEKICVFFRIWE